MIPSWDGLIIAALCLSLGIFIGKTFPWSNLRCFMCDDLIYEVDALYEENDS